MWMLLVNLLIRYTKCSVRITGSTVCLVWDFDTDTVVWSLHANKNTKIVVMDNKLKKVKFMSKVKKLIKV